MAVNYAAAVKTARITASRDYHANGTLEIQDGAGNPLVIFGLSAAGGTIAADVWTLVLDASTVAATGGTATTATQAVIKNSIGTVGISGLTVGTAAADIILDSTSITTGQNVTLTSATIQHAA